MKWVLSSSKLILQELISFDWVEIAVKEVGEVEEEGEEGEVEEEGEEGEVEEEGAGEGVGMLVAMM